MDSNSSGRVADAYRSAFPDDRPAIIEGGDGTPVRIRGVSATIGAPSWLNVWWVPFGDTGGVECVALPAVFEGEMVRYHCQKETPLTPEEHIIDAFTRAFLGSATGTIDGDDGTPVEINALALSSNATSDHGAKYGCPPGELAILADWLPSGLRHARRGRKNFPKEAGVDLAKIPPAETWVVFPKTFQGLPVYYKRGSQAFAFAF